MENEEELLTEESTDESVETGFRGNISNEFDATPSTYAEELKEGGAEMAADALEMQQQLIQAKGLESKDQGFLPNNPIELLKETGKAVYGGATDAVESVGSTLDLAGDTIKTGLARIQGLPAPADEDNILAEGYKPETVRWLDIPDRFEVENESGLGNLTRGLVEFGVLIAATRGVGKAALPGLYGTKATAIQRLTSSKLLGAAKGSKLPVLGPAMRGIASTGKGAKIIKFIPKGFRIGAEGSVADLISSSSDYANIANLVEEYIPWFPFAEWLSVDPDSDNPWTARLKTVLAGGGANLAAHGLVGFARGRWAARKAKLEGKTDLEANKVGNIAMDDSIKADLKAEVEGRTDLKNQDIAEGKGVSPDPRKDYILRNLDEDNAGLYSMLTEGNLPDSRGNGIYFHGSQKALRRKGKAGVWDPSLGPETDPNAYVKSKYTTTSGVSGRIWYDENLFGNGFYATDDINVAIKNRKQSEGLVWELDEAGENRILYQVKENQPVKLLDADKPFKYDSDDPVAEIMRNLQWADDAIGLDDDLINLWVKEDGTMTYAQFIEKIKDEQLFPRAEVTSFLDEVHGILKEQGYGGLTYKGSISNRPHQVRIYWEPDTQLNVIKAVDDTGAKIKELEGLADSNGAAKGDPWVDEVGSSLDDANKTPKPTPDRNPDLFSDAQKTTVPADKVPIKEKVSKAFGEKISSRERTGKSSSNTQFLNEGTLRRMSNGNKALRAFILKMAEQVADEVFKSTKNSYDWKKLQKIVVEEGAEIYARIEEGGADALREYFKGHDREYIHWMHDGFKVETGTAAQKIALEMTIHALSKRASMISSGALDLGKGVDKVRQLDDAHRSLNVALTEHKKISYMTGNELARQNLGNRLMPEDARLAIEKDLKVIELEADRFRTELDRLVKEGNYKDHESLLEIWQLTDGKVRTMQDVKEWLSSSIMGGRFKGQSIKGRWRTEGAGFFYNSILSGLGTPVNAVLNTNFLAVLRPYQQYLGAMWGGSKADRVIAAAQIDAVGESFAEGLRMFKHNWDLGVNRKKQTYQGKFDIEADTKEWKEMGGFVKLYGTENEKIAYGLIDWVVEFNNSPWVRYSQNAMGAGDALARTIIGRMEMRMRSARKAVDSGIDLDDVGKVAADTEDAFRREIFKQDKHEMWVVNEQAARMAGDETAFTKRLSGNLEGLEKLRNVTGMRLFFPFVRTGFNALDMTFQSSPLAMFHGKWRDLLGENVDPGLLLKKYGIRPEDIPQAQALMKGRMASGTLVVGLASVMALQGRLYGTRPKDKETRDLWKMEGIQPNSFKIGNTYISFQKLEPFNTILSSVANIMNYQHVLGEAVTEEMLEKTVFMAGAVLVEKSMLAGVADLAEVFSANTSQEQLLRITAKFGRGQLAPYAGLMSQIGGVIDANEKEANGFWETMFKRDAIGKAALPPKYDILNKDRSGKKWMPATSNPLMRLFNSMSPFPITWTEGDKVKENLRSMSFNLPEIMRTWKGERLTSREISQLQKILSQSNLRARLEKLMRSGGRWEQQLEAYKKAGLTNKDGVELTDQEFYADVQRIFLDEKKKALTILRYQNPSLYSRIKLRQSKKLESKTSDYEALLALPK